MNEQCTQICTHACLPTHTTITRGLSGVCKAKAERCSVLLWWKTTGAKKTKNRGRSVRGGVMEGGKEVWTTDKEVRGRAEQKQRHMDTVMWEGGCLET